MELEGCDALREAARGCGLVLLTATMTEAKPLLAGLEGVETHTVATKELFVGRTAGAVRAIVGVSGCDKANAAHLLTCLLQAMKPRPLLVLQVGVAGALLHGGRGAGAEVGDIVLATEEIYSDTGSSSPAGWLSVDDLGLPLARVTGGESGGRFVLDARLIRAARAAIEDISWPEPRPKVVTGPCVTSSRVTGLSAEGEEVVGRWRAVAESMEGAAAAHTCALYGVPFLEIRGISNLVVDRDRASWEVDRAVRVAVQAALAVSAAFERLPLAADRMAAPDSGSSPLNQEAG
ncbi:MAG: futalosine hydrolase [bacterium]